MDSENYQSEGKFYYPETNILQGTKLSFDIVVVFL